MTGKLREPASGDVGSSAAATELADRPLTTLSLACLVAANMIGVGVFTTSGFALASLPGPTAVMAVWAGAGAIALIGAICYGGLARQVTESGGEYLFLARGVHPLVGFMAGWISLVAGFSGAIGLSAVGFAKHLEGSLPVGDSTVAVALIICFTAINLIGLRPAASVQNVLVLGKLVLLVLFVLYALPAMFRTGGGVESAPPQPLGEPWTTARLWGAVASNLMWISFSFAGYNAAIYIAGAARNCRASVPRAMLLGTLVVTALYLVLNAVFVFGAPAEAIAGEPKVAIEASRYVAPAWMVEGLRMVILVSLATSVLAMIQTGPHVYAQMARDGHLPRWLDSAGATPRRGVVLQAAIACALVLNTGFLELLEYLAFLLSISSAATIGCLLLPRFRGRAGNRPVPLWPWLPLVFVAVTAMIAVQTLLYRWQADPGGLLRVLLVLPVGLAVYWWMSRRRTEPIS